MTKKICSFMKKVGAAFYIKDTASILAESGIEIHDINELEYETVSDGKKELRGDVERLCRDWRKSTRVAREKIKNEEPLTLD